MSDSPANADRVIDIAEAVFDRTVSDSEIVELNAILLADRVSRDRYLDYCRMQVALRLELRSHRAAQEVHRQIDIGSAGPAPESDVNGEEPLSAIPPIVIDVSSAGRYPPGDGLFAVGGPLFSYAAALVITGMLVLGTWVYKVSLHGEVSLAKPAPPRSSFRHRPCWWAKSWRRPIAAGPTGERPRPPSPWAASMIWPRDSWKSAMTPGPRSFSKGLAPMKSIPRGAVSSRWVN